MSQGSKFPKLFEPGKIRNMQIKNRYVMAPMAVLACDRQGYPTQQMFDYYAERAKGGVGLIIVEAHWILRKYAFPYRGCLGEDACIPSHRQLVEAVHGHGCKIAIQLHHLGVNSSFFYSIMENPDTYDVIGASAVPFIPTGVVPRELSKRDIAYLVEAYGEAARRAKEAGYDAVEIHGAHGYLISQFLSPFTNKRTDEYGGSVENRARFACEVIIRVREKVGPDYPILMKINAQDGIPYGKQLEDTLRQAPIFAKLGVDALDVSCGISGVYSPISIMETPEYRADLAGSVKKVVDIPVIAVGRLGDQSFAEQVLEKGQADFIALGRQLLADPDFPNKLREGRLNEIVKCLSCNNCTERKRGQGDTRGVRCSVNPSLLRESEFAISRCAKPKRVMVVGAGPGGMQAATVLAQRGHRVFLYEREDHLGGQWHIASSQDFKKDYASLIERMSRELREAGVVVTLNKEVTSDLVREIKPDAVVLAAGAEPIVLNVPGIGGKNVVAANDLILGRAAVGDRVVVIGGRLVGMEVALSLAKQGKKVSIVTLKKLGENGKPMNPNIYLMLRDCLIDEGVCFFPHSSLAEVNEQGALIVNGKELMFLKADTIVLAVGANPENKLFQEIRSIVKEVYTIGDCVEVRTIVDATNEGAEAGMKI